MSVALALVCVAAADGVTGMARPAMHVGGVADTLPAFVIVTEVDPDRTARRGTAIDTESVNAILLAAFRERGVHTLTAVSPDGVAAAGKQNSAFAACAEPAPTRKTGECVRITARITYLIANSRQTVNVSLHAQAPSQSRTLHAQNGRAGPYALDIPAQRVVERAVESIVHEFADMVLEALRADAR